jgi:hypothetical protein
MARTFKAGPIFFVLFALPFAAVGIGMSVWLFSGSVANWKMQRWKERPATIVRAELKCHSGSKGSTTYEATAEYRYEYDGREYQGNRVSAQGGSDNVGSYQQDIHRQLMAHSGSRHPFRCYVNPDRPAEAILFRDLRWEMVGFQTIFATAFGTVGLGLFAFGVLSFFGDRGNRGLAALHPDEPWLCKKEWAEGKIVAFAGTSAIVLFVVTLYWNLASAPVWFVLPHNVLDNGNRLALLLLVFPAIGLTLALCAIVSLLRLRKYGKSVFEIASVPGVIGGQLAGVIRVSKKVEPEDGFRLTLNCVQRVTTTSGKDSSTSEHILWQDEDTIARELPQSDPGQSAIPVLFQIPYECRPSDETDLNNQTIWRLEASAKTPGLDYKSRFEVPVFKTPQSDPAFKVDRSLIAQYEAPVTPDRVFHEAGLVKTASPSGEGFRLVFPMARTPGMALMWMVMGLIFGGAPIAMYYMSAPWIINIAFGVVFGAVGLLLLMVSADTWFYRSVVDVSPAGLTVVGGWLGFGRETRINAANIEKIEPVNRMNANAKVWYDIQVVCRPSKKITIGKRIPGKHLADTVIGQIEQAMGRNT